MAVAAHLLLKKGAFLGAGQQGLQKSAASVHAQIKSYFFRVLPQQRLQKAFILEFMKGKNTLILVTSL